MSQIPQSSQQARMWALSEVFPSSTSIGPRDWGSESLLALVSQQFSVKKLELIGGKCGGLQYHRLKNEVAYVVSGQLAVRFDLGDGVLRERILGPGEVFHFPPGLIHQECAISDCIVLEVSTPHFNDRVRVEDEYGLTCESGLPTTTESEIESR